MQDRQYCSVANRAKELVYVPGSCQRPGLRFAVAYYCGNDQLWVVECCAAGMRKHVSQFASFVNRTGSFRRAVAADAPREGKLSEELVQAYFVLAFFGINFRVRALEIPRPQDPGRAVSRTSHENHVEIEFLNQSVQVDVGESEAGAGAPMSQQAVLDMFRLQRLLQQRIVAEIDHPERQ